MTMAAGFTPSGLGSKLFIIPKDAIKDGALTPVAMSDAHMELDMKEKLVKSNAPKSWKVCIGSTANLTATDVNSWLKSDNIDKVTVTVFPDDRRLPRKMKKGFRAKYLRDTKWKRKASNWRWRKRFEMTGTLHMDDGGITISGTSER